MSKRFARIYDQTTKLEKKSKIYQVRRKLIERAHGRVLEIGSGTGINFPLYNQVDSVDAIEPNIVMINNSMRRAKQTPVPIHVHQQTAENLSFSENTFDSVVCTLVFCTIPDPVTALKRIQYVAKPGATILFLEHVKMSHPFLSKIQDILTPISKRLAGGCHLNRDTLTLIEESGLKLEKVTSYYKGLWITVVCKNQSAHR